MKLFGKKKKPENKETTEISALERAADASTETTSGETSELTPEAAEEISFTEDSPETELQAKQPAPSSSDKETADKAPTETENPSAPVDKADPRTQAPFVSFALNIVNVLFRPNFFWKQQSKYKTALSKLFWPHLLILVSLRSLAFFVGSFLNPEVSFLSAVLQGVSSFILIFLAIFIFAFIIAATSKISGSKFSFSDSLRFISYAVTPLLFIGFLAAIPMPYIRIVADFIAMPHSFFVMGAGIVPLLNIPAKRSAPVAGLFCGILLCVWGALPTLVPILIHFFMQTMGN